MDNSKVEKTERQSTRSILSQVVASSAQTLMLIDLVMSVSFSTLVIADVLNNKGPLSFTKEQASWFGSIFLIVQPFGSIFSGVTLEPFGRKKSLMFANIPHIVGWLLMYFAPNVETLFLANILLGMGTGFMEAPVVTYVGEISHPSFRGTLVAFTQMFGTAGTFLVYFFGSVFHWRHAALACLCVPLITFVTIVFIPEAPVWLISKGRTDDAMKALCWSRGWTEPENVQKEFNELVEYQKISKKCESCIKLSVEVCTHKATGLIEKLKENIGILFSKKVLRPMLIVIVAFLCHHTNALLAIRPNVINVYKTFGFTIDPHYATAITAALSTLGVIVVMCVIKYTGKRRLIVASLLSCVLSSLLLGMYAFNYLDHSTSSYGIIKEPDYNHSWIPITIFSLFYFLAAGATIIPWVLLSEVFPLRGRGMASGIAASFAYIIGSITTKTYYNLETGLGLYGAFWFYGGCSAVGALILYLILPETEGKSLEEIEKYFNKKNMNIVPDNCLVRRLKKDSNNKTDQIKNNNNIADVVKNDMGHHNPSFEDGSTKL